MQLQMTVVIHIYNSLVCFAPLLSANLLDKPVGASIHAARVYLYKNNAVESCTLNASLLRPCAGRAVMPAVAEHVAAVGWTQPLPS